MRQCLFLISIFFTLPLWAETGASYIILKARVIDEGKAPTWLCLNRRSVCIHVAANEKIVTIKPGKYKLDHVDFNKSKHFGEGTRFFSKPMKFNFEAETIYFIGELELKLNKRKRYKVNIKRDPALLLEACKASPELFEKYVVTGAAGITKHKLSCIEKSSEGT